MAKLIYTTLTAACLILAGCTCDPSRIAKVQNSLLVTQAYYDVLVSQLQAKPNDAKIRAAVIAADTALALAGALQAQNCPPAGDTQLAASAAAKAKTEAMGVGVNP